jgi:peroxidase
MAMASRSSRAAGARVLAFLTVSVLVSPTLSQTCPQLDGIVTTAVQTALRREIALAAGLLRIFFHDCLPNGCDASVYLKGSGSEQSMGPNRTLQPRALQLIEDIRAKVHAACGPTVSCADISTLATRAAVVFSGGPTYAVPRGVLDSLAPAPQNAVNGLPAPSTTSVSALARAFSDKGLRDLADLVALSGAHTVGRAACGFFSDRAANGDAFGNRLAANCTRNPNLRQNLDVVTPDLFDNGYYRALVASQGVFTSDMVLIRDASTAAIVRQFANSKDAFFTQFAKSMAKLATAPRPGGNVGEIRRSCFSRNARTAIETAVDVAGDEGFSASA